MTEASWLGFDIKSNFSIPIHFSLARLWIRILASAIFSRISDRNPFPMKKLFVLSFFLHSLFSCAEKEKPLPRIAIAGIAIESSTF